MDWERWQAGIEEQITQLRGLETTFSYEKNCLLPAKGNPSIKQLESQIGHALPDEFVEFYERFDELSLPDVWNAYFIVSVEQMLHASTPRQLQSPEYTGNMLIFGSDGGGHYLCMFFGIDNQPILYLPNTILGRRFVYL